MRALFAIVLIVAAMQPLGTLVVLEMQRGEVRREIKQRLKAGVPEEALVHFTFPKDIESRPGSGFQRIHSREFRYRGDMYDIVRTEDLGDSVRYACIHDVKESRLFANLDELIRGEMSGDPERRAERSRLLQLLPTVYLPVATAVPPAFAHAGNEPPSYRFSLHTWDTTPPLPPPRG